MTHWPCRWHYIIPVSDKKNCCVRRTWYFIRQNSQSVKNPNLIACPRLSCDIKQTVICFLWLLWLLWLYWSWALEAPVTRSSATSWCFLFRVRYWLKDLKLLPSHTSMGDPSSVCIQSVLERIYAGGWYNLLRKAVPIVNDQVSEWMGFYGGSALFFGNFRRCPQVLLCFTGVIKAGNEMSYMPLSNLYASIISPLSLPKHSVRSESFRKRSG